MKINKIKLKEGYYWEYKEFYYALPTKLSIPEKYIEKVNTVTTTEENMVKGKEYFTQEEAFGLACKLMKENDTTKKYNLIWFKDKEGELCEVDVWLYSGGWNVGVDKFNPQYVWDAGNRSFFRNESLDSESSDTLNFRNFVTDLKELLEKYE